ncbi:hypothetical protein K470DRAFT_212282 [Piedraia hortae CBS 480.64]|uniref:Dihydrolipoamide acetyltransferase component of pyruvate dehydrogenase complex n=1 Tax=Piedraia hortae CBS 480.64 TaxID=1314780 RepID=A0A6A7C637_9PEZI|nr:hypothetical protein K470DRAFT_212282 [Piedraia hortae CBS 480.64]
MTLPRLLPIWRHASRSAFHSSSRINVIKPFVLADIGEGITECQLIQWFVQPGARVEQFDKICEVQSDKAMVEITSPYDGVVKKLHYEPDDMAITGKPLVDIDAEGMADSEQQLVVPSDGNVIKGTQKPTREDIKTLTTPAVRQLTRKLKVNIADVQGTGKDGRVLKEDVHRYAAQRNQQRPSSQSSQQPTGEDRKVPLTPVQSQMFKRMSKSLQIPHFLYTCTADVGPVTTLRRQINSSFEQKLTHLPFIIKAVSIALHNHPLLNASLDAAMPELTYHASHNIGVAIDAPSGLVVPVLKGVQDMSIIQIALRLRELSTKAAANKLTPSDFSGATITISNIGSIGGGVVSPVVSESQVAIVGVGRSKMVPAFDKEGNVTKKEELVFSWSADHRVIDGAECARCAERVRKLIEEPGKMMVELR